MKIKEIVDKLNLQVMTEMYEPGREIAGGYSSDLLSDVIANSKKDYIWITLQTHVNIAAVASLKELSAIIVVLGKEIDVETIEKAKTEKITILRTDFNAFQICGKLYEYRIR